MTLRWEPTDDLDGEDEIARAELHDLDFASVEVPLLAAWDHARAARRSARAARAARAATSRRGSFGLRITAVLCALAAMTLVWC